MREDETSEDGGELVTVVRRCFFPPVQQKQFVVTSSSRKHQPLFPLNQQCKNGVSVWVKTREREEGAGTVVGRHVQLHSPAPSAPLLLFFLGGHTEIAALPLHFNPPCTHSLGTLALTPPARQTILSGICTLGKACLLQGPAKERMRFHPAATSPRGAPEGLMGSLGNGQALPGTGGAFRAEGSFC